MILLDVNVLVYAARRDTPQHRTVRAWLDRCATMSEPLAVTDDVLAATVRLLTNHRISASPLTPDEALAFCAAVRRIPGLLTPTPGPQRWATFNHLVSSLGLRGNDIPDAYLAATALDMGASFATFDRGFTRFHGLNVIEPAA